MKNRLPVTGAKVLLADRHGLVREGLRAILARDASIQVVGEAASGLDTVRLASEQAPEVVIMDVDMKDLGGGEIVRRIHARHRETRVIALSVDTRLVADMLRAGVAAYLLKESAYTELRRAVDAVCRGGTYLCPRAASAAAQAIRESTDSRAPASRHLGAREREVLRLLAEGLSAPQIAATLHIAPTTVETHRRNIMRKLDLHNVVELTRYAIREGLTTLDR